MIGFIDSGIGGLSIFEAVTKILPDHGTVYVADHAFFPYGEKTKDALEKRVVLLAQNMLLLHPSLQLLVIACNTASTTVLPYLRAYVPQFPIVGTVPGIKPAAKQSSCFGVLATPLTAQSPYLKNLIQEFAPTAQVVVWGSTELVALAEKKLHTLHSLQKSDIRIPSSVIEPFLGYPDLDLMVLACTHFPFLLEELKRDFHKALNKSLTWFEPSLAIGEQVKRLLVEPHQKTDHDHIFYTTHRDFLAQPFYLNGERLPFSFFTIHDTLDPSRTLSRLKL